MPKFERPNPVIGPGSQPILVLHHFIIGAFENAAPGFVDLLQDQIQFAGANPRIKYEEGKLPVLSPEVSGPDGQITIGESFLSYLWALTYATLVMHDEQAVRPRQPGYVRTTAQQQLITDAERLFRFGMHLTREYAPWPLELLPNPAYYNADEAFYVEKADAVFVYAAVFVLLHEFAHFYYGHLQYHSTPAESKAEELAADLFAIQTMQEGAAFAEYPQTALAGIVIGFGAVLLMNSSLSGGDTYPDADVRFRAGMEALNLSPENPVWSYASLMLMLWAHANKKPAVGAGSNTYESPKQLFEMTIDQLKDFVYRIPTIT